MDKLNELMRLLKQKSDAGEGQLGRTIPPSNKALEGDPTFQQPTPTPTPTKFDSLSPQEQALILKRMEGMDKPSTESDMEPYVDPVSLASTIATGGAGKIPAMMADKAKKSAVAGFWEKYGPKAKRPEIGQRDYEKTKDYRDLKLSEVEPMQRKTLDQLKAELQEAYGNIGGDGGPGTVKNYQNQGFGKSGVTNKERLARAQMALDREQRRQNSFKEALSQRKIGGSGQNLSEESFPPGSLDAIDELITSQKAFPLRATLATSSDTGDMLQNADDEQEKLRKLKEKLGQ